LLMMSRDELDALGAELLAADEDGNARRLAELAWRLYGEAGTAQSEIDRLHGMLRSVRAMVMPTAAPTPAASRPAAPHSGHG
jgi:hypothetical protein